MFETLWQERHKPKTLNDIILSPDNRAYFSSLKGDIPHFIFVGPSGIGKTTLARVIVQDILKCQYLYINASDENGIDTIRNKVTNFAQTKSIDGALKVVILDECDGLSIDAQRALRNTVEEYQNFTRFIFTANFKHKIMLALQSRAQAFDLTPPIQGVLSRAVDVLNKEKIVIPESQKRLLVQYIKNCYPDIRKVLSGLQRYSVSGTLNLSNEIGDTEMLASVWKFLADKKALELRKFLIENESRFQGDYSSLLRQFLNFIYNDSKINSVIKPDLISVISEHLYRDVFVADKEINSFACMLALQKLA
jgi:replication factor C small subunit